MAAGTKCYMRLVKPNDASATYRDCHTIQNLKAHGFNDVLLLIVHYEAAFPNGYAETSAPNAVFDGTSTAAVVYVDSSDAKDTAAGDGVRSVTIIGILESGLVGTVTVATGGTTGTSSVTKFQRIFHAYASSWGVEPDAAGNILIQNQAADGGTTYLTIAAGTNESDGAAFWVPSGYKIGVAGLAFVMTTSANANAALLLKVGYNNFDSEGTDPDFASEQYRITVNGQGGLRLSDATCWHTANGLSKVTLNDTYKGNAETGNFKIAFVMYKPTKGAQTSI